MTSPDYLPGARYGIRAMAGDTLIPDLDIASQAMRDDIENKMAGYSSGTHGARPGATIDGHIYRETDTSRVALDTGTAWLTLFSLTLRAVGSNVTANPGELVSGGNVTVTLPSATTHAGALVGVRASASASGAAPLTIATGVGEIVGGGSSSGGSTSMLLGQPWACMLFFSDGTNWQVLAGQQDTGWVTLTLTGSWSAAAGGFTPSVRLIGDRVWLKGGVTGGSGAIATLPAPFRPTANVAAPTLTVSTGGALTVGSSGGLDGVSYSLA